MASIFKLILGTIAFITIAILIRQKFTIKYPDNLPRIRESGRTRFSLRTRLAWYTDCKRLFQEAYETYSKNGLTCLVPGIGCRDEIILPTSAIKWVASQPDDVLSIYEGFVEADQADYSAGGKMYITDPWQSTLVRTDMNKVLERLCGALNDELVYAFEERFGTDMDEWRDLHVLKTMKLIIAQASSRFTVGLPLCRDEEYLAASIKYTEQFVIIAGITSLMPKFLRPLIGNLLHIPQYLTLRTLTKHLAPLLEHRISLLQLQNHLKSSRYSSPPLKEPEDHLQMMIRYASSERPHELASEKHMTRRLAMANLASYHQTTLAATNLIFNILASDAEFNTISILRKEIASVVGENGEWTKATIAHLVNCDSVCKESLRMSSFGNRGLHRVVMTDHLVTPDGIPLPRGSLVSILNNAQVDPEHFGSDPWKFVPFRYSDMRDAEGAGASFVSLGERFLPFGYGKHACPGRFLLEFELKMMLARLLMGYEVELAEEHRGVRPESKWVAEAVLPPGEGKIWVRRRKL